MVKGDGDLGWGFCGGGRNWYKGASGHVLNIGLATELDARGWRMNAGKAGTQNFGLSNQMNGFADMGGKVLGAEELELMN